MSKSYKREAAQLKTLGAQAAGEVEGIKTRRAAAEETYQGVLNRLGAPGTYENVGGSPTMSNLTGAGGNLTGAGGSAPDSPQDTGIFKTTKAQGALARDIDRRFSGDENITNITSLDSQKSVDAVMNSSQGRTMSRLQAESEQLLAREGPLFESMQKNLQNPIIEGAGAMARENAAEIKRAMARGGAARRGAFEAVQKMRQQEQVNQQRITAINQSRFSLDQWARNNARTNIEFGQNWASNLGGVRESFNAAMDNAAELMTTTALPFMVGTTQAAAQYRRQAHAASQSGVTRWAKGIVGAVMMYWSGGSFGGGLVEGAINNTGNDVGGTVGQALGGLGQKSAQGGTTSSGQAAQSGTAYSRFKGGLSNLVGNVGQNVSEIREDLGLRRPSTTFRPVETQTGGGAHGK